MTARRIRLGATLITFYRPEYWGLPAGLTYADWTTTVDAGPRPYFDRMLDGLVEAGVEGVELAPAPGNWQGALRAYGSVADVGQELAARGLTLGSSYQSGSFIQKALDDPAQQAAVDAHTDEHAAFVSALGGDIIVTGNIQRAPYAGGSYGAEIDEDAAHRVADQLNGLGAIAARHGVRVAIHTDAYSFVSRDRDIDRMMSLTDPANVMLCLDAGHATLDGGDAVSILRTHIDRVPVMHWKDCVASVDGASFSGDSVMERHDAMMRNFRIFGEGNVDWRAWQGVLRDADWSGWAMAENDMAEDPVAEIRRGIEFFERELAGIHR